MILLKRAALALALSGAAVAAAPAAGWAAVVLVGNTTGNNIVLVNTGTGSVTDFIGAGSGGLVSPDDLNYGPDGNLYVSSGTTTGGAILRYDGVTGDFIDTFATSSSLQRPYGSAFGPDGLLYVSSFRSDEILTYDADTGAFAGVFAAGDGTEAGLLNGPNDLLFGADGKLYVTTQGSVAQPDGSVSFGLASQVLRYDPTTGAGEVFVPQPAPWPSSFGFVSYLGLAIGPDGYLYTTDFANGIRAYDLATGAEVDSLDTNYTGTNPSGNFVGNLLFDGDDLIFTGFLTGSGNIGSVLGATIGAPATLVTSALLQRPIGIVLAAPGVSPVPLPAPVLALLSGLLLLGGIARRRRAA